MERKQKVTTQLNLKLFSDQLYFCLFLLVQSINRSNRKVLKIALRNRSSLEDMTRVIFACEEDFCLSCEFAAFAMSNLAWAHLSQRDVDEAKL
jgi:hypothetical protein